MLQVERILFCQPACLVHSGRDHLRIEFGFADCEYQIFHGPSLKPRRSWAIDGKRTLGASVLNDERTLLMSNAPKTVFGLGMNTIGC